MNPKLNLAVGTAVVILQPNSWAGYTGVVEAHGSAENHIPKAFGLHLVRVATKSGSFLISARAGELEQIKVIDNAQGNE